MSADDWSLAIMDEAVRPMKVSMLLPMSEEIRAEIAGFERLGHFEPVEPSAEEIAQHARAVEIAEEIRSNPYISIGGYDWSIEIEPLQTRRWVFDETHEEYMARWAAR